MITSEQERRDLLFHYMSMEPTIHLNAMEYTISVEYGHWYIVFYAICKRLHEIGAMALVTKDTWKMIDRGLPMAVLYTTVLQSLESAIAHGYECSDIIEWR